MDKMKRGQAGRDALAAGRWAAAEERRNLFRKRALFWLLFFGFSTAEMLREIGSTTVKNDVTWLVDQNLIERIVWRMKTPKRFKKNGSQYRSVTIYVLTRKGAQEAKKIIRGLDKLKRMTTPPSPIFIRHDLIVQKLALWHYKKIRESYSIDQVQIDIATPRTIGKYGYTEGLEDIRYRPDCTFWLRFFRDGSAEHKPFFTEVIEFERSRKKEDEMDRLAGKIARMRNRYSSWQIKHRAIIYFESQERMNQVREGLERRLHKMPILRLVPECILASLDA